MANSFLTDNMTADEIISMKNFDDVIANMNTRDVSRTLRTLSLVANKRVNRLLKQAKRQKTDIF